MTWQASNLTYLAGRAHLDGADHLANEMERKWGSGRLRLLVSADLRGRFDAQRLKLNGAIAKGEVADLEREAKRMEKAWIALDASAEAAGAFPLAPEVWDVPLSDGRVAAFVRRTEDAAKVAASGREVELWTLEEVARVIEAFPEIAKCKKVWPGARVEAVRRDIGDPLDGMGDEIPF